jgi:hypothetical protein
MEHQLILLALFIRHGSPITTAREMKVMTWSPWLSMSQAMSM